jgi:hypothetical protein
LRLSVGDGLHRISTPAFVSPSAPSGLQNAPACTPLRTAGIVGAGFGFFVVGFGFGFGLVTATGLRVVAGPVVAGRADVALVAGTADAAVVGLKVGAAGLGADGTTKSGRFTDAAPLSFGPPMMAPITARPPTHRTTTASTISRRTVIGRTLRLSGG